MNNKFFSKFKIGDQVSIKTELYAKLYNSFLDDIGSNKQKYSEKLVNQQIKDDKRTRPVVILYNDIYSEKVILVPESSVTQKKITINHLNTNTNKIWFLDILTLDKNDIDSEFTYIGWPNKKLPPKHRNYVYKKYNPNDVQDFFVTLKNKKIKTYLYLDSEINRMKLDAAQKYIEHLKRK